MTKPCGIMQSMEGYFEVLNNLSRYATIGRTKHGAGVCVVDNYVNNNAAVIYDLICTHFDNPPLMFKDIETDLVVFDKKLNEWIMIDAMLGKHIADKTVPYVRFDDEEVYTEPFEENRFFRKKVEE